MILSEKSATFRDHGLGTNSAEESGQAVGQKWAHCIPKRCRPQIWGVTKAASTRGNQRVVRCFDSTPGRTTADDIRLAGRLMLALVRPRQIDLAGAAQAGGDCVKPGFVIADS